MGGTCSRKRKFEEESERNLERVWDNRALVADTQVMVRRENKGVRLLGEPIEKERRQTGSESWKTGRSDGSKKELKRKHLRRLYGPTLV